MAIPHDILVPIIHSAASLEAVAVAAALAKQKKGRVYVVHVIEVGRGLPLNAELDGEARRGEQLIRQAEEIAAAAGYPVTGTLLQAREAGPAIVDEALDHEVQAIIMGLGSDGGPALHKPSPTIDHVMKNATCAVWVVRQSVLPKPEHHHE